MKRFFLFIVIMLTAAMTSRPQQICPNVSMLFNKQRQLYPQEKLFIHTDRTSYMPGERIWLCIYAVDATSLIPTDADMYAYAELLDTQGFTIKRIKIARHNGAYAGYLDTPKDLAEEQCFLRCYTLYSAGLHGYECLTPISIGSSPAPVTDIQTADAWEKSNPLHCTDTGQAFKISVLSLRKRICESNNHGSCRVFRQHTPQYMPSITDFSAYVGSHNKRPRQ